MKLDRDVTGSRLYCPICSDYYSLDHAGKCDRKHTLIPYPPPKLSPTEAVATQLLSAKRGSHYTGLGSQYGYGHADRLLRWAEDHKLVEAKKAANEVTKNPYRAGAEVTDEGEKWLEAVSEKIGPERRELLDTLADSQKDRTEQMAAWRDEQNKDKD